MTRKASANPMWGGHFSGGPSEVMEAINQSIEVDKALYRQDISGSKAHVSMLAKQNILTEEEAEQITRGLSAIEQDIEAGHFSFRAALEDIHMNIEAALKEKIGEVAGKLHTARSRNDQVATDFRLWLLDSCARLDGLLHGLQQALYDIAKDHTDTVMPGYTHLQTAQPVTFGHHLHAYIEMFGRDRGRLTDCKERANECPLGAAALAGTSFPIDRHQTAETLGFHKPTENSLDSVSARDFALEYLSTSAILGTHLSRLSEELVLFVSSGFQFITLSERYTTGSSIMPQKRNPDAAELIRAKTGRFNGSLMQLLTVMKGLPLAYSKDMQEDKECVFAAAANMELCLNAMKGMFEDITVQKDAMHAAAQQGFSTATDLADWLVRVLGLPFRECHHITGRIVNKAAEKGVRLDALSLDEMQSIEPRITEDVFSVLSVEASVSSRTSYGGTAPEQVKDALSRAAKAYGLTA